MGCENFGSQACTENDQTARQFANALDNADPRAIGDPLRQQLYDRPPELATDLIQRIQAYERPNVGADLVVNPVVRSINTPSGPRYVDTGDREVNIVSQAGTEQIAILRREQDDYYDRQNFYERPPQRIDPFSMITSLLVGVLSQGQFQPWRGFPHMRNSWMDRSGRNWMPTGDDCWGYDGMRRPNPMMRFPYQSYNNGMDYQNWRQNKWMMMQQNRSLQRESLMRDWWQRHQSHQEHFGKRRFHGTPDGQTLPQGWNPQDGWKPGHGKVIIPPEHRPDWDQGKKKPDWRDALPKGSHPKWDSKPKPEWPQGQIPDWVRRRQQGEQHQKHHPLVGKPVEVHRPPQHKPVEHPQAAPKHKPVEQPQAAPKQFHHPGGRVDNPGGRVDRPHHQHERNRDDRKRRDR